MSRIFNRIQRHGLWTILWCDGSALEMIYETRRSVDSALTLLQNDTMRYDSTNGRSILQSRYLFVSWSFLLWFGRAYKWSAFSARCAWLVLRVLGRRSGISMMKEGLVQWCQSGHYPLQIPGLRTKTKAFNIFLDTFFGCMRHTYCCINSLGRATHRKGLVHIAYSLWRATHRKGLEHFA